jgi:hypothetical protein
MARTLVVAAALVATFIVSLVAGCGNDEGSAPASHDAEDDTSEYCDHFAAYITEDTDTSGLTSPDVVIEQFAAAAVERRRAAEAAPDEIRAAQERLALLSETTVERLREEAPTTTIEAIRRANEIEGDVVAELGGLEEEGEAVRAFVNDVCPFNFNQ